LFLAVAGAADMMSGVFRSTIWNQTIPDSLRGRLASIEMLSYTSGPALGNFEAGVVASAVQHSGLDRLGRSAVRARLPAHRRVAASLPRLRRAEARRH
jgi:hypothetical protein